MSAIEAMIDRVRHLPLPARVQDAMARIRGVHGDVWVVGGAIRDWVWAPETFDPKHVDWDLATTLSPVQLMTLRTVPHPGEPFGTFWLAPGVEVTSLRSEGEYGDFRHPDHLAGVSDVRTDLGRRDFTVNAVAYDGHGVVAVDGALDDLVTRTIRAVGNPCVRMAEDPLRILRLVRFQARFRALVDPDTAHAARTMRHRLTHVSRERRLEEFVRFLENPPDVWELWHQYELDTMALDWPAAVTARPVPSHPAPAMMESRIAAYAWLYYDDLAFLNPWADVWPLTRLARRRLNAMARVPFQLDAWVISTRMASNPHREWFRAMAVWMGADAVMLDAVKPVLGSGEIRAMGIEGPDLGRLLRYLERQVAAEPRWNTEDQLRRLAYRWRDTH